MKPEHVFVLMLENRSFDHMLGYSHLAGVDGLAGNEQNLYQGNPYSVSTNADFIMPVDPGHEFQNVLEQLTSLYSGAPFPAVYPPIDNSGFVASYVRTGGALDPGEILKCFSPANLPVINALAAEFAVCDRWFSSLPGPTWPNRMFAHAASSAGLEVSPTNLEIAEWEARGYTFPNGHIFDKLKNANPPIPYHLYSGDDFPMVSALHGISIFDIERIDALERALQAPNFPYRYVFIEPSYNIVDHYRGSSSQHPFADIRGGEALIERIYAAIRNSAIWEKSLLIVTWDEHGGFYDHVAPGDAVAPGDTEPNTGHNQGFTFLQYGVRVPAVIVSPFIPQGTVDHSVYDHSSIPKTLEVLFSLTPMTERDKAANHPLGLMSLSAPRATPSQLPSTPPNPVGVITATAGGAGTPQGSVNVGALPAFLQGALRQDISLNPTNKSQILANFAQIQTRIQGECPGSC